MDTFQRLAAPFPPDRVSWRVGSTTRDKAKGMALAYIDARDVMDRLDEVCGPDGWERRHPHVDKTTTCEIAIWIEGRGWVVKSDGAGDTAVEAEKGSLSDSFKRAAVNWGIGRYLYDLPSPWVELEARGNSQVIPEKELTRLRALLGRGQKPSGPTAPPAERPAPEADAPSAADAAIHMLDTFGATADELKACWEQNKAAWRNVMSESDFRRVRDVVTARAAAFKAAAETKTNGHTPPPKNEFGLAGDDVPQFN